MPLRPVVSFVFLGTNRRLFYTFPRLCDVVNHYEVLDITPSASPADVKRQFYALSKKHHPDRNPNDPEASHKFAKISEAYTVLGNTQKRQRYDRDTQRTKSHASGSGKSGVSSSGPAGGRPASGLSRRRTQFRGPPPSFYRSGGWGEHSSKRQSQANTSHEPGQASQGFGGQESSFSDDYVPHFDRQSHFRTQEQQDQHRRRRRAREEIPIEPGSGTLINFIFVGGIVSLAVALPAFVFNATSAKKNEDKGIRRK